MEFNDYIASLWLVFCLLSVYVLQKHPIGRRPRQIITTGIAAILIGLTLWGIYLAVGLNFQVFDAYNESLSLHGRALNELGRKYLWFWAAQMATVLLLIETIVQDARQMPEEEVNAKLLTIINIPFAIGFVNSGAVFVAVMANLL